MIKNNRRRGFTLIELMIVVAVVAVIVTLAAPSFRDMILMQRLKGINAQLVTDLAFARSEAISRGTYVQVRFQNVSGSKSCYSIASRADGDATSQCDCISPSAPGGCLAATVIRSVEYPISESVSVAVPTSLYPHDYYTIDPRTGGIVLPPIDAGINLPIEFPVEAFIDSPRKLRNLVGTAGRIKVCTPSGSTTGETTC